MQDRGKVENFPAQTQSVVVVVAMDTVEHSLMLQRLRRVFIFSHETIWEERSFPFNDDTETMEPPFVVPLLLTLFFLGAMTIEVERKGHRPGDTVRVCSYLCMMSQCPDSCRIFVGMKWSRRRSLDSLFRIPKIQLMPYPSVLGSPTRKSPRKIN